MAADIKEQLLNFTLKHVQGRVFEADEYYKALETLGPPTNYAEALVDVFWILWVRFEVGRGPESMNLVAAIKACWQDKRVTEKQLLQVLEPDCLHTVGLIRDKSIWDKKAVRYNTKLNYTILKYNLFREDSEGYAKLVTLYNNFGAGAVGEEDLPALARELQALIGSFDLDPNRCLDLLLDAAAAQPQNNALLGAVGLLKGEAVGQLMGFKLEQYQDAAGDPAPRELLLVAAQLVRTGRTSLPELLGHLTPSDEQQATGQRGAREALMRRVAEIGQINLGASSVGDGGAPDAVDSRDRSGKGGQQMDTGRNPRSTGLSAASFELDPSAAVGPLAVGPDPPHNQPLALLDALLQVGAWDAAVELHDRLVSQGATPAAYPPISEALSRLLAAEMAPAYDSLFPQGVLGRNALWGDVVPSGAVQPQLSPMALRLLGMLGLYIHRDIRLFTKVLRVLRYQLAFPSTADMGTEAGSGAAATAATSSSLTVAAQPNGQLPQGNAGLPRSAPGQRPERYGPLDELLATVLLPALSCCPVHLPLAADVWECVKLLPMQSRYRIYAEYREFSQSQPMLQAAWRLATVETKKVLKRLVLPTDPQKKKEACRPHARMVAKVAHANPLPVMEAIVTQVEVYDNQIEVSLEALKYLSPFSYDVLTYVILSRLAVERDKVKEDGVNISGWLQSLARFTGAACRRFSDLDVGAVLQFLVNTLRAGDSFDLLVLQQIIVAMTGVRLEAVLSDEQLDALAGGPELVAEAVVLDAGEADAALGMGRTASAKDLAKGRQRLLRALEDADNRRLGASGVGGSLTLPLLILTAQQRSIIINHTDAKVIKFIATMYDRCQDTLLHLTEFLRLALPVESYADMLPTPDILRREYGIDVEVVWHIYRPVMSSLLEAAAPQPAEEGELEEGEDGGTVTAGLAGDAPIREETRVGDKTWSGVLAGLPTCAGNSALWSVVTPELYATFWSLQLQDIYVPVRRYEKELSNVKDQLQLLDNNYMNYIRPGLQSNSGYISNNLQQQYEQYKIEKATLQEKQSRLTTELEQRRRHVDEVKQRLVLQRGGFFLPRTPPAQQPSVQPQDGAGEGGKQAAPAATAAAAVANGQKVASANGATGGPPSASGAWSSGGAPRPPARNVPGFCAVAQEMFLPRILFSALDAAYCARLVMLLHHLEIRHFSLIPFLDSTLRAIIPVLRSMTEVEANNFGVFMFEMLKQLVAWHRDEKLFNDECVRKTALLANAKQPHNVFKSKMMLWHGIISSTFRASLESGDYTQIANALSVMGRLVTVWPGTVPSAASFRQWVEKLQKEDPREDIKTMARSYLIALSRETDKPGRMMSQLEYGGPNVMERQRAMASSAANRGNASSPPTAPKNPARPAAGQGQAVAGAPSAAAAAEGAHKPLNAAAKPFVPRASGLPESTATAGGGGGQRGPGPVGGSVTAADGGDHMATDAKDGMQARGLATVRKRARIEGRADVDKADETPVPPPDRATGGDTGGVGSQKKPRVDGNAGALVPGAASAAAADDTRSTANKSRGGGGDRDGADTMSEAGGRAGSETSGRVDRGGADAASGGREGKSEKEHKEHKRSKEKDREKERGSNKDKDKDKERSKGDREEKEESRREEKERRREEKERERAEKAEESRAIAKDRHGTRRNAAADDTIDRERDGTDGGSKRRRMDGKSEGGVGGSGSPGHGAPSGRGGSITPDAMVLSRRNATDTEIEYDERGGFALPPAPAMRGGGGAGPGSAITGPGARGAVGQGAGLLPPPSRSSNAPDTRRRGGR
ncbi:hypothetical protein Vretimale_382 [Volvox reticuliferus]|uniref:THO complex subunit 2 n=1 Tax=Volvox reticuliferus TaxID=1737510 RepID=A0A8J4FMW7_9CHLO|nr:hypothetical protein Vretifemale_8123 [Volvox reticuliferus]GIL94049.1 hypothetical protein Vretimale_382 [Volvox reticuliferus]